MTKDLAPSILSQQTFLSDDRNGKTIKNEIRANNKKDHEAKLSAILEELSDQRKKTLDLSRETGASAWLTTLPLVEEGYAIPKNTFWDLI